MNFPDILIQAMDARYQCGLPTSAAQYFTIKNSVECGFSSILYDLLGKPMGYICWAKVSKETLHLTKRTGKLPRYPFEWNEGEITLITDVVIKKQWSKKAIRDLLTLRHEHSNITYHRNGMIKSFSKKCFDES